MWQKIWRASLAPLIAAASAIIISSIALIISGNNPIEAFQEMWKTIDSTQSVVVIINTAVPLYIAGVAAAIGFKMNLFNIGTNGQYLLAALVAGWAGAEVSLPPLLHVPFVILVAITVGGSLGTDRRHLERHPQRQRGRVDDHAQLHRDRAQRVPARRGVP